MGVVRLRLARFGCANRPFYRVVAADSRAKRDGKHLEILGYYNPLPVKDGGKRMGINFERTKHQMEISSRKIKPDPGRSSPGRSSPGRSSKDMGNLFQSNVPRYWLSVGAQPSDPVQCLLFRAGLLPPPPMLVMRRKGGPRDERPVDPLTGRPIVPEEDIKQISDIKDDTTISEEL
ncbi:small ribosomal subunit protein bS16m/bS16c isoform X1 [Cryptomeria japonica]|uniref:small ribosomal subunit protein bS16m/bS16c isoform X1 n=1 Tax=Cryptomeria japonica TaxID=3369 RepID=UPI0025AC6091|nr:small ribosomal subunit protein bS16m/bS16c isoform X1 [Cryptomeria japonica]XP_057853172.1 small ribosomal subunit protein bS16m/bS16c isoform X1 [Cryptomeria japonica]